MLGAGCWVLGAVRVVSVGDRRHSRTHIAPSVAGSQADLAAAEPFLHAANEALNSIQPSHIVEMRTLKKPSDIIRVVLDQVRCAHIHIQRMLTHAPTHASTHSHSRSHHVHIHAAHAHTLLCIDIRLRTCAQTDEHRQTNTPLLSRLTLHPCVHNSTLLCPTRAHTPLLSRLTLGPCVCTAACPLAPTPRCCSCCTEA